MNSRRKFLIHGSLATTALIVAKPFKSLAASSTNLFGANSNSFVFIHTADLDASNKATILNIIDNANANGSNVILLKAVNKKERESDLKYDAAFNNEVIEQGNNYDIIRKNGTRVGVIYVTREQTSAQ